MRTYLPLLTIFLIFASVTGLLFFAVWAAWTGPRRIRRAVWAKGSPRQIQASVKTSFVYWLLIFLLALAVAGLVAYLCWWYLGYWLYGAADDWHDHLATALNRTLWVWLFHASGLDYDRIIPVGVVLSALLGVVAGVAAGTRLGTFAASRRYLITRAMF